MFKPYRALLILGFSVLILFPGQGLAASAGKTAPTAAAVPASQELSQQQLASLLAQVEKKYASMQSLECSFEQHSKSGGRVRQGSGQAFFFRPGGASGEKNFVEKGGIIRWEYLEPEAQTIINDGKEIQIYSPADKQLLISSAETLDTDITYALFTGQTSLTESFLVTEGDSSFYLSPPPAGLRALHLVPKEPQSQLKQAQIWINKDMSIERLLMEDYFNAITELSFNDMRFNAIKPGSTAKIKQLRTLKTTADTEIIRQ